MRAEGEPRWDRLYLAPGPPADEHAQGPALSMAHGMRTNLRLLSICFALLGGILGLLHVYSLVGFLDIGLFHGLRMSVAFGKIDFYTADQLCSISIPSAMILSFLAATSCYTAHRRRARHQAGFPVTPLVPGEGASDVSQGEAGPLRRPAGGGAETANRPGEESST